MNAQTRLMLGWRLETFDVTENDPNDFLGADDDHRFGRPVGCPLAGPAGDVRGDAYARNVPAHNARARSPRSGEVDSHDEDGSHLGVRGPQIPRFHDVRP